MQHTHFQTLYARFRAYLRQHGPEVDQTTISSPGASQALLVPLDPWAGVVVLLPLSSTVILVRRRSGTWCLTDTHRFSPEHDSFEGALGDRTAFRRLSFGESWKLAKYRSN